MITEAIILAGGLGTRLRSAIPELPKCMAPVRGRPFIDYVLQYLSGQNINRFVLALGYKAGVIQQHIQRYYTDWDISFSIEEEPLGTGGAIAKACKLIKGKYAVVTNGDTLYKAEIMNAENALNYTNAACLLFLKPMVNTDRYGVVEINEKQQIVSFKEKQFYDKALINGGLYVLDVPSFLSNAFPHKFSFEKDYLETGVQKNKFIGIADNSYFIDIGVPEDYLQAQKELLLPGTKL